MAWRSTSITTWGKSLSYTGGDIATYSHGDSRNGVISDFNEVKSERSLSSGDVTHSVSVDWVYQAPTPFASWQAAGRFWEAGNRRHLEGANGTSAGRHSDRRQAGHDRPRPGGKQ